LIVKNYIIYGAIIVLLFSLTALAEDDKKTAHVDLDGDGFNDNIADNDENGIPDRFESEAFKPVEQENGALGDIFNTDLSTSNYDNLLSCCERFGQRKFRVRALTQRCHGFGLKDDFGSGSGIGLGSLGGAGGCAGGVCGP
jgi:hypothetical protein